MLGTPDGGEAMRLTKQRRELLQCLSPDLISEAERLEPTNEGWRTTVSHRCFSDAVVRGAIRVGLIDNFGITQKGMLAYQDWLADHSGVAAHD